MGLLAGERSDIVYVTSDNPRTENPDSIISEILPGLSGSAATVEVEVDRREAIRKALQEAGDGDLVVIAGKGHEDYQEIEGVKYPFDDREVVRSILRENG
jgi:UDP-N-acetylmuramoyl-L-alanyl-D-glutamate--2,6-diaminopimelate ligase